MSFVEFAKSELERAGYFDEEKDFYGGETGKAVVELMKTFSKQRHSGMSAGLIAFLFFKLVRGEPLTPLTGEEDEWMDNQNKRCPAVFRDERGAYYLDAIVWVGPDGTAFTGTVERITSCQRIKFPFSPRTFYVKVSDPDDKGERGILDRGALEEALEYFGEGMSRPQKEEV